MTIRREEVSRYSVADRVYSVWLDGVRIGEVARDDVDPFEPGAVRHLWHAWLDPFPCEEDHGFQGWNEAVGNRTLTRREAVFELGNAFDDLAESLGLTERVPW